MGFGETASAKWVSAKRPSAKWVDTDPECKGFLLGKDPESPLYEFLRTEYSKINEPFQEFYEYYAQNVDNPLNKNYVFRALTALGLKTAMKK